MLDCVDVKVEGEARKADVLDALNCAKAVNLGRRDYMIVHLTRSNTDVALQYLECFAKNS
jgi:hypothetical protein